jgi:hypothetical protein
MDSLNKKTKFSKVIWFVDTKDEMEIRSKIGDRADFIFVKTLDEFKGQINKNNYMVYSVEKMNDSDDLTKVIHSNPDCIFHELFNVGKVKTTESHALSRLEKNINQGMWLDDIFFNINEFYIEKLKDKTIDELEIMLSKALYDEFKDDPEYQRRFSQITEHLDNSNK